MLNHLIRQFGLTILGLCIFCAACEYRDGQHDIARAVYQNTAQISNAVACRENPTVVALAGAINSSQLYPKGK